MDLKGDLLGKFARILAILSLLVGLGDAARLLGVGAGSANPISVFGVAGFAYLATFSLARLFAAVGLWIGASWGLVLLAGATVLELVLFVIGSRDVHIDAFGFAMRLVLIAGIGLVVFWSFRQRRVHD